MGRHVVVFFSVILALTVMADSSYPEEKQGLTSTSFVVPTPGKILDVEYRPEFDEWWIKCREGDAIAVYSYDPRSRKWGKVQFVVKQKQEAPRKPSPRKTVKAPPAKPAQTAPVPEKKEEKAELTEAREETKEKLEAPVPVAKPEPKKEEKRNWWDPRNLFKRGK